LDDDVTVYVLADPSCGPVVLGYAGSIPYALTVYVPVEKIDQLIGLENTVLDALVEG